MVEIIIPGTPIAKKRPRFARIDKFVRTYDCQETEEGRFLFDARQQWNGPPMEGPVFLTVWFYMPIPKGTSHKKTEAMKNGLIKHTKKPDCDNLVKFVKDCLNRLAWKDDSQVYRIEAEKIYSDLPRTKIIISGTQNA